MTQKNPGFLGRMILDTSDASNGIYLVDGTTIIDSDGNIDAPITTTDLTTTGNTVLGNGGGTNTYNDPNTFNATVTVGVDDTGYDVKLFGATSGSSLLWDESADALILTASTMQLGGTLQLTGDDFLLDSNGNELIGYTANGSAANYVTLFNRAAGMNPGFTASGTGDSVGIEFSGKDGTNVTNAGGLISNTGGVGNTSGAGGAVTNTGGQGGATGTGGAASLTSGAGGATSGASGAVTLASGTTTAATGAGTANNTGLLTVTTGTAGGADTGTAGDSGGILMFSADGADSTGAGGTGGNTGDVFIVTGDGGSDTEGGTGTGGNAGNLTLGAGSAGSGSTNGVAGAVIISGALLMTEQAVPTAKTTATTLTAAELRTQLITGTHTTGGNAAYQSPTGANLEAVFHDLENGNSFEVTFINLSAALADTISLTVNTGVTIVGQATIDSAHTDSEFPSSGTFRFRRSAADTFVAYRIS